jgi:calpain
MLKKYVNDGCLLGCSADGGTEANIELNGEDTGLKSGHAYAIIDVMEIPDKNANNYHKSHRLIRVRNPWGFGEWQLKWSEKESKDFEDAGD